MKLRANLDGEVQQIELSKEDIKAAKSVFEHNTYEHVFVLKKNDKSAAMFFPRKANALHTAQRNNFDLVWRLDREDIFPEDAKKAPVEDDEEDFLGETGGNKTKSKSGK